MTDISFTDVFRFFGYTFLLIAVFSCGRAIEQDTSKEHDCFLYKEKYRGLYLRNCDFSKIPDSIAAKDIKQLVINSSELVDFEVLSRKIDLTKIISIRIDDLNQPMTNLNLARFKGLKSLNVFGGDQVNSINFINLSDSLTSLALHAPNLTFPLFDSSFLALSNFYYGGKSEVIPQWIESLCKLESFHFDTERLSEIKCDVCKLDNLFEFDIVDRDVEDKELHLRKMPVYPTIQKFKECRPHLRFWNVLPPY